MECCFNVPWFTLRLFLGLLCGGSAMPSLSRSFPLPSSILLRSPALPLLSMTAAFRSVMLSYAPIGSQGYAMGLQVRRSFAACCSVFVVYRSSMIPSDTINPHIRVGVFAIRGRGLMWRPGPLWGSRASGRRSEYGGWAQWSQRLSLGLDRAELRSPSRRIESLAAEAGSWEKRDDRRWIGSFFRRRSKRLVRNGEVGFDLCSAGRGMGWAEDGLPRLPTRSLDRVSSTDIDNH